MVYRIIILAFFVNLIIAETVWYGGELYIDGQNARNAGMGGYSVSLVGGRNPALLIHAEESSAHFSHKDKFAGLSRVSSVSYLHYGKILGKQTPLYFSIVNRSVNNIPNTRSAWMDDGNLIPEIGEINYLNISDISQNELGLKVAFLRKYNSIAIGVGIKPTYINLANYNAFGLSGDIAVITQKFDNKMDLSIRVEDFFSFNRWSRGKIETTIPLLTAGGQLQMGSLLLGIEMGFLIVDNSMLNYHAGFEFRPQGEIVIIRGGMSHNLLFSAGVGFNLNMIQIDYAYLVPPINTPFEPSQILSVGIFLEKFNWIKSKITP